MFTRLTSLSRRVRRGVLAHRRLLAFLLTASAVAIGFSATRPAPPDTSTMAVAARDLPVGTVLTAADLTDVETDPGRMPADLAEAPLGERLAAPLRRGEPVTDVRLVGPSLTDGHPDLVAVPVRLPDAEMAALLRVGDTVDLYATDPATAETVLVTTDTLILSLPQGTEPSGDDSMTQGKTEGFGVTNASAGRLVIVGVAANSVEDVTSAGVGGYLTFAY
ncbi:SAF domain-containing protein [Nocardioides albus]|uniref:Flp pilus assembly protein CpaB n=1 Tax=Nocardioides albus TaxID=1841 RepID=A0A7W5A0Z1_9ACTN|nr:SAF domain-containing protein [Nocardioides albus]MBB3087643.1 Flp pilus assembly protein CpaB [Nocardioides albus]GGU10445.1 flagellar basal body P-ring biosynthesis protein [Nocardioides albus]